MTDDPTEAAPRPTPSRRTLSFVVVPLIVMVAAGYVAGALWPTLVESHPVWLIGLSSQNRYLVMTVNQIGALPYYLVGTLRLLAPDPLFYLLGFWYGESAVRWMEGRTQTFGQILRWLEGAFKKWGGPLVFLAPNNFVCLVAGSAQMPVGLFAVLNVTGTIFRLVVISIIGDIFSAPINWLLSFVAAYRIPLLVISVVAVAFTVWSETRKGTSEIEQLRALEHELDEGPDEPTEPDV